MGNMLAGYQGKEKALKLYESLFVSEDEDVYRYFFRFLRNLMPE